MKKFKFLTLVFLAFFLLGCAPRAEVAMTETRQYILLDIDPPKHFKITIQDKISGQIYRDLRVSKRCSAWRSAKINNVYDFKLTTYVKDGRTFTGEPYVKGFCDYLDSLS